MKQAENPQAQKQSARNQSNTKYQGTAPINTKTKYVKVIPNTTKISDFCWHEVTEEEKEKIKKDSKKLLDEFASKLDKIKAKKEHFTSNTKKCTEQCKNNSETREEGNGWQTDPEFKSTTLSNAPFVEDDSIVAEKGGWKK